jgi:hemolysin activation/secretion protein
MLGAVAAQADDAPRAFNYGFGFENGGTEPVGPYKVLGYMLFTNQLGLNEKIKFDAISGTSDFEELDGVAATLEQPLGDGWKLTAYGGYNIIRPGDPIARFFDENTDVYSTQLLLSNTFKISDNTIGQIRGGLVTTDVETDREALFPALNSANFEQRSRDLQLSFAARHDFSKDTGLFGSVTLQQGVDLLDPVSNRDDADETPTVLIGNASFTHNLPHSWQFAAKGILQWTDDRLTPTKQFSIGGWEYATAYRPGEAIGDIGGGLRVELNHVTVSELPENLGKLYTKPFVFFDTGFVRVVDPARALGEVAGIQEESSAGFGISLQTTTGLHGSVQFSYPLSGESRFAPDDDDTPRILFSVGIRQ